MSDDSGGGKTPEMVLHIRTADIKSAAPMFQEQAKNLSKALTTLIKTLDGLGKPWGDDKQGKEFEDVYAPQQRKIESAAGILVLGLTSIHEALVDLSDGHVANDELVRSMFTKVKVPHQGSGDSAGER
ncbi:hypothetical protein [Streptomyces kaempferi]|uniref:WXG100 family type VII secretion target n=1 Tax=Streptomyces kaempferi TaxID=333725 RepID=A0ABW3XE62_9ACTN